MKPTITKIGVSIPFPTPRSKFQLISVVTSFIRDDHSIYDYSVVVLETICHKINFGFDKLGIYCGI